MTTPSDPHGNDQNPDAQNPDGRSSADGRPDLGKHDDASSPAGSTDATRAFGVTPNTDPNAASTAAGPGAADPYAQTQFTSDPYGQPAYGQDPYGQQAGFDAGRYPQGQPYGQDPNAAGAYGTAPYAQPDPFGGHPAYPAQPAPAAGTSFFGALFDLKFENLVATRVIPVLYVILLVVISAAALITSLAMIIGGFASMGDGDGPGILGVIAGLIVVPIGWLLYLIIARVMCELYISIFKITEYSRTIAANTTQVAANTGQVVANTTRQS